MPLNLRWRAETLPPEIMRESAWTGIHRGDQDEGGWKCERHLRPCDRDSALLEGLPLLQPEVTHAPITVYVPFEASNHTLELPSRMAQAAQA